MTKPMNADEIASGLRSNPTAEKLHSLVLNCETRRQQIRARLEAIAEPSPGIPLPPARREAIAESLAAIAELDHEVEGLQREFSALDRLESQAGAQAEALKVSTARDAAPGARRKLPKVLARVRKALAELDAAIAETAETLEPLAAVAGMPGAEYPLNDAELTELLELREECWQTRTVPTLHPQEKHAMAFAAQFDKREDGRLVRRTPPHRTNLRDVGEADYR